MLGTRLALKRLRLPAVFLAGLALGALLTLMASAALSSSQRGTLVEFGSADWFGPERGPVCNWHHHFCIVTLEDGELVALYTYDTHPEFRRRGCTVH